MEDGTVKPLSSHQLQTRPGWQTHSSRTGWRNICWPCTQLSPEPICQEIWLSTFPHGLGVSIQFTSLHLFFCFVLFFYSKSLSQRQWGSSRIWQHRLYCGLASPIHLYLQLMQHPCWSQNCVTEQTEIKTKENTSLSVTIVMLSWELK